MAGGITILDGGMGRELLAMGAPFRQPDWSALALIEAPDFVARAHRSFVAAGADVITTNSYALVPFHIGQEQFDVDARDLADRAGRLARQEADAAGRKVLVAGSLPPVFGSYRPDLFQPAAAPALLRPLIEGLAPHVDLWLAETQSSRAEVEAIRTALGDDPRPLWLSFTLAEQFDGRLAKLRSGEGVAVAVTAAWMLDAQAILFNCSPPEVMDAAAAEAAALLEGGTVQLGIYANAFVPDKTGRSGANQKVSELRDDTDPESYLVHARRWTTSGASIIGGCCGIGPEHVARLASELASPMA